MPDDENATENTEPASAELAPTEAAPAAAEPTPSEPAAADAAATSRSLSDDSTTTSSARGWIWGAAAVVVIGLVVGAYFVGQSSVNEGPTSLADAAHQTANGDLPVGDLNVNDITGALGKSASGILGGKSGTGNDLVDGLLNKLGKELQNKLEDGLKNGLGGDNKSGSQLELVRLPRRQQHQRAGRRGCRGRVREGRQPGRRRRPPGGRRDHRGRRQGGHQRRRAGHAGAGAQRRRRRLHHLLAQRHERRGTRPAREHEHVGHHRTAHDHLAEHLNQG